MFVYTPDKFILGLAIVPIITADAGTGTTVPVFGLSVVTFLFISPLARPRCCDSTVPMAAFMLERLVWALLRLDCALPRATRPSEEVTIPSDKIDVIDCCAAVSA
jgi:hypothetical protein